MPDYLTPRQAMARFAVSKQKLADLRRLGLVRAVNLNPDGQRPVWRYADRLEVEEGLNQEIHWQALKRRCGL